MSRQTEMLIKPSMEEIIRQGSTLLPPLPRNECESFFYYYGSNGWRVGKNPMKCWKSALAGWHVRWRNRERERLPAKIERQRESSVDRTLRDIGEGKL